MNKLNHLISLLATTAVILTTSCKKPAEEIIIEVEKPTGTVAAIIRTNGLVQDYRDCSLPLLPMDSVKVTLSNKDTSMVTLSDKQGLILFSNVKPGAYQATLERFISGANIKHTLDVTVEKGKTTLLKNYIFDCFFFQLDKPQKKRWTFIHFANLTDPALMAITMSEIRIQEKFGGSGDNLHNVAYLSPGAGDQPSMLYLQKTPFTVDPDNIHAGIIPPTLFSPRYYFNSINRGDYQLDGDPGDFRQLDKIIRGIVELYPADSVALFIYDHGSGIGIDDMESVTKSVSYNPNTDKGISMPQLRKVIEEVKPVANISALIMDACFMAMYEVAYELKNTDLKYIIASPPSMSALTSNEAPLYIEKMGSGEWSLNQMCHDILDKSATEQLSLFNMKHLGDMTTLFNDFATKLNKTDAKYIDAAVSRSKIYSNNMFEILSCFYDLGYFANQFAQLNFEDPIGAIPAAQKLVDYIKNPGAGKFLEQFKVNPSNKWPAYGISIFLKNPEAGETDFSSFRKMYRMHQYYKDGNKDWDEMMDKIGSTKIQPWDGSITKPTIKESVVHINLPSELAWVAQETNSGRNSFIGMIVKLNIPIDLGGENNQEWIPIGTQAHPFKGTFEGSSNTPIYNLSISDKTLATDLGLFGCVDGGEIKNCDLYDCHIDLDKPTSTTNDYNAGGVCGRLASTTVLSSISNCSVSGGAMIVDSKVAVNLGGIVGFVDQNANVSGCIAYTQLYGKNSTHPISAGAICGAVNSGGGMSSIVISNCYTQFCSTRIESTQGDATSGGIVGTLSGENIKLIRCESAVSQVLAKGKQYSVAGGVIGSSTSQSAQLIACYNACDVTSEVVDKGNYSTSYAGGICGSGAISIFACENQGSIKQGQYRANILGAGSGIISSCCAVDATFDTTADVYGFVGKVDGAMSINNSYYTAQKGAIGIGNATMTDCHKFSKDHWPTNQDKGWGPTPPMGWDEGTWNDPWDFIGSTESPTKYPTLKRLR